ncbi:hypothetical protein HMPREF0591_5508 [Mycobacterium parascrofulaceum ATCC BAA-614]|uniref:Uncharacterized protein n=1 Tax=Mycobacterium parascrofulaceum ATCC BAA-614 TaxID=525368 RepID=D5PH64_9MYCO|nr:hypothetical protein HMPREF0591_5508 [Mycobacterium parascrofulaceum ATCC BAA-614]
MPAALTGCPLSATDRDLLSDRMIRDRIAVARLGQWHRCASRQPKYHA